jgi:anthranilate synthase component 2
MKLLIIDNYDSFTYNLKHYASKFCSDIVVCRNDAIRLEELDAYDAFIISPGPGLARESGISFQAIRHYAAYKKILGVCLGHQAIAEVYGSLLINLSKPLHGLSVETYLKSSDALFKNMPSTIQTGRYHSWVVDPNTIDSEVFDVTATDVYGQVQALKHRVYNLRGVQFHPESVLTDYGLLMIENWIKYC